MYICIYIYVYIYIMQRFSYGCMRWGSQGPRPEQLEGGAVAKVSSLGIPTMFQ